MSELPGSYLSQPNWLETGLCHVIDSLTYPQQLASDWTHCSPERSLCLCVQEMLSVDWMSEVIWQLQSWIIASSSPLRVWDGWLAHAQRLERLRSELKIVSGAVERTIMGTAATHPECQPGLTSLNKMIIITSYSLSSEFLPRLWMVARPETDCCVSIMMSGEMMMNWVRETKTVTITPVPMVTRHDSYSVISISPGKLLSTYVLYSSWLSSHDSLFLTWPPRIITSAHILLPSVVIVCSNC